ncbi:C5a anaphylatoxin chemotactic receptor 1 [Betta splendens]|uniref:C5a anaphylatoxin chemotactic receptor 1 n=1 Tax=Betta splendens TaxID=158456 RepID=A0A6P7P678_BETSP|nr:C5a anaphylatoxin chemotactic receptor 1 [Betta splendens]
MNSTDYDFDDYEFRPPDIQPVQIAALFFYSLVVLLGVPGNAVVLWVTGFCMPHSVTSLWFLNLALADLLCCLSLPLLMIPLAHDDKWHFGPVACTLVKGLFYLVMYCSILQLVVISVDRWLLVSRPVWCQNRRRPVHAALCCVAVWLLALVGSIPQFVYASEEDRGEEKRECVTLSGPLSGWLVTCFRFLMGFLLPLLIITACHIVVYCRAEKGLTRARTRSKRTLRVIVAVILSFFLCWLPLHIVDFLHIVYSKNPANGPKLYKANISTLCLAYFNSCLNPLLYVCLGRGFKDSMARSMRNVLHFISEDPTIRVSAANMDTKSTSNEKEMKPVSQCETQDFKWKQLE